MTDRSVERYGAVGGELFVLLDGVATALGGAPPGSGSAEEAAKYFVDYGSGLQAGLWLFGLSTIALTWRSGSLWTLMVRTERSGHFFAVVSLAGLIVGGSLSLSSTVVMASASLHPESIAGNAAFVYSLGYVLLATSGFGLAVHVMATIVSGARSGALAHWLVGTGAVAAVCLVISGVIAATSTSSMAANVGLVGFLVWCVWILGISYRLWNDNAPATQMQRT